MPGRLSPVGMRPADVAHEGTHALAQHSARGSIEAAAIYMNGLSVAPREMAYRAGLDQVLQRYRWDPRHVDMPERWVYWPWNPKAEAQENLGSDGDPPTAMPPPFILGSTPYTIDIGWSEYGGRGSHGGVTYECEVCSVNPLLGPGEWRKGYRGRKAEFTLKEVARELSGVRVRVRAITAHGKGEWSESSALCRCTLHLNPDRELAEMPAEWLAVDLAGMPGVSTEEVGSKAGFTALMQTLYECRSIVKLAFRYYALAGVATVEGRPAHSALATHTPCASPRRTADSARRMCGAGRGRCQPDDSAAVRRAAAQLQPRRRGMRRGRGAGRLVRMRRKIFLRAIRAVDGAARKDAGVEARVAAIEAQGEGTEGSGLPGLAVQKSRLWKKAGAAVAIASMLKSITAGGTSKEMTQAQFAGGLLRVAAARDSRPLPLQAKFAVLCTDVIAPHVYDELQLVRPHRATDTQCTAPHRAHGPSLGALC